MNDELEIIFSYCAVNKLTINLTVNQFYGNNLSKEKDSKYKNKEL
jgi:hypothetical protein